MCDERESMCFEFVWLDLEAIFVNQKATWWVPRYYLVTATFMFGCDNIDDRKIKI